jgi:hypothetical protein
VTVRRSNGAFVTAAATNASVTTVGGAP